MNILKTKIKISGFQTCPFFLKASSIGTTLECLFPARFVSEITSFESKDQYRAALTDIKVRLPGSENHNSSPIVWLNDSQFIGGFDAIAEWARKEINSDSQSPFHTVPEGQIETEKLPCLKKDYDYDLVVIGGGSGGLACSKTAADLGAKVAIFDFVKPSPQGTSWGLGGTCVNVGCIPKKLFHNAAMAGETLHDAEAFGWKVNRGTHDWSKLMQEVSNYIRSMNFGYKVQLREKNIKYLNNLGSLLDTHTVRFVDKKGKENLITAERVLIAVGGRPSQLSCPGSELAITSDDLFSLEKPPGKTLVIGASYVALECASFLNGFGYDTTVMVRSILLRGFDQQMTELVGDAMKKQGVKFLRPAVPNKLERMADGRIQVFWDGENDVFDTVLVAIGRSADLHGVGIENAGLAVNSKGKLDTQFMQTANPAVFAIGDCVQGVPELTPVAIALGQNLAKRIFGTESKSVNMHCIPTAVFAGLEYSCVGASEELALAELGEEKLEVYHTYFTPLQWTLPNNRESNQCYCKVLVDKSNDLIVGIHLLSPEASEIVQAYGIAMKLGATWSDLQELIGVHPTIGEELCLLTHTKSDGNAVKSSC